MFVKCVLKKLKKYEKCSVKSIFLLNKSEFCVIL